MNKTSHAGEFKHLAHTLAEVSDKGVMHAFLKGILTPQERENIALRWKLLRLLEQGNTQRAIADELGISLCKITRGSRELKRGSRGFAHVVRQAVMGRHGTTARRRGAAGSA
jgi:TrpR family trp operon transcriptional repressor